MDVSSYINDSEPDPWVFSEPPAKKADGYERAATIHINLFGPNPENLTQVPMPKPSSVSVAMSVEEAEQLAINLVAVVRAAKDGQYSEFGEDLKKFVRDSDLQRAWKVLMGDGDT